MLIDDNGKIREMTPEEIMAMEEAQANQPPPQPTPAQEIAELKRQDEEMRRMIETAYMEGVQEA